MVNEKYSRQSEPIIPPSQKNRYDEFDAAKNSEGRYTLSHQSQKVQFNLHDDDGSNHHGVGMNADVNTPGLG